MALLHSGERVRGVDATPERMAAAGPEYGRSIARMQVEARRRRGVSSTADFAAFVQRHPLWFAGGVALGSLLLFASMNRRDWRA